MSKYYGVILGSLLMIAQGVAIAASQLQATVDPDIIALGETCLLTLELSQASTQDMQTVQEPDLSPVENTFEILGQQKFISSQTINGQANRQISWQYRLAPQKVGQLTIPAIALKTSSGQLRSQPLTVTVNKTSGKTNRSGAYIEASVSETNPYLYQPIYYTLRLYHQGQLRDLQPIPPTEGVITEQLDRLTQKRKKINGKMMIVSEVTYLLTPLRSGKIDLEAGKMKGAQPDTQNSRLGQGLFGFTNYVPITLQSDPLTLEVQPPPTAQRPWLPLKNLTLTQEWETDLSKPITVGFPLMRTLHLVAEGMGGQPFPELDLATDLEGDFRVRHPKPETERTVLTDGHTPVNQVTQTFSLIPLRTGKLSLPAIRIPWWDIKEKKQKWVSLPAQTIEVLPTENSRIPPTPNTSDNPRVLTKSVATPIYFSQLQYFLLSGAILALFIALVSSWMNRRIESRAKSPVPVVTPRGDKTHFKQKLRLANELAVTEKLIQEYAQLNWQLPPQASLRAIVRHLRMYYSEGEALAVLLETLEAALYGKQPIDLQRWKYKYLTVLTQLQEKERPQVEVSALVPFNP
jgi:hypothetical protein